MAVSKCKSKGSKKSKIPGKKKMQSYGNMITKQIKKGKKKK